MKKAIVGKKIGMTQIFTEDGRLVPVTVIKAGPCTVVQTKTVESDGYNAVQVGFGELTEKRAEKLLSKPVQGHYKKAGVEAKRVLREFRFDDCSGYKVNDVLKVDQFVAGDKIDVTGTSKGHGFTGPVARWNQHTGPMAHGSKYHRGVGSMSANSDPSRVFKNKHMGGHYGVDRVTVQNLEDRVWWMLNATCCWSRALCPVPTKACWSSATRSSDAARRIEQWLRLLFTIWKARPLARLKLSDAIFASDVNVAAMHLVVRSYSGRTSARARRAPRPARKSAAAVARSTVKRAPATLVIMATALRSSSHGGVVFAPKPRDYVIDCAEEGSPPCFQERADLQAATPATSSWWTS